MATSQNFTNYPPVPAGVKKPPPPPDTFSIPGQPEYTPLSEAGSGNTLDHPELHEAINQAVMALEQWSALCTHDHSGDPNGTPNPATGPKLVQANTHQEADTDSYGGALHHTLGAPIAGPGNNPLQASPANHNHNYNDLLQIPFQLVSSRSRPSNPYPGMMIYETDTNRARIWSSFPKNAIASGLYSADYFNVVDSNEMGNNVGGQAGTYWDQLYSVSPTQPPAPAGVMATADGATCAWIASGNVDNWCIAQRSNSVDATTMTDDQVVSWQAGTQLLQYNLLAGLASNDVYLRMSSNQGSYVRISITYDSILFYYTTSGPSGEGTPVQTTKAAAFSNFAIAGAIWTAQVKDRTFTVLLNGQTVATWTDGGAKSSVGSSNRGWGIGMHVAKGLLAGQIVPASVNYVTISDWIYYTTNSVWQIVPIANVPICQLAQQRGAQTIPKSTQAGPLGGVAVAWDTAVEDSFGFWHSGSPSLIQVSEPGRYHINVYTYWPSGLAGVGVAVQINGHNTNIMAQQGISLAGESVSVSGYLYLAAQDQVSISVFPTSALVADIESLLDIKNNVQCHMCLAFISP